MPLGATSADRALCRHASRRSPHAPAAADAALRLIRVDYAPLPFVVDPDTRAPPDAPLVYQAGRQTPSLAPAEIPVATGLPLTGNVRGPETQAPRRCRARLCPGRDRGRRRLPHADADPLLHGAARDRRRLAGGRPDGLDVHPVHRRRAPRTGASVRPEAQPGAGEGRGHGRRLRLEIVSSAPMALCGHAVAPGAARRCGWCSIAHEEQLDSGNRPATWQHLRIGARRDGTLTAISLLSRMARRASASAPASATSPRRMYTCPNFSLRAERRVHQCRPRLGDARARQHARRLRAGAGDRRAGRTARARSAGAARPHRPQPGAARGTAHRRAAHRLGAPPHAGRRCRADQARPRRGAVAVGRQRADQCLLRSAPAARRFGGGAVQRAGPRHRHRHDPGAGGGGGIWPAPGRHHGAHRRHRFSRRAAVARQPHHRLDHAAGAHRGVEGEAGSCSARSRRRSASTPDELVARDGRIVGRATIPRAA